ncbi:hypothetical protein IH561_23475, partial [Salmonella enterica subsp. enterica serovar Typhimurium]|uniref:phosphotransferase n=1 Tax=Salmonella enterica TaxID=28901 RepID=UPI0019F9FF10|nr:hypothetical protein [Salmonella enterica subsp. enterica serovar Typhimurium]
MNRTNIFFGESHSDWLPVRGGESGDFVFRRGDGHAFAKIAPASRRGELAGERDRLIWLKGRGVACPEVINWQEEQEGACLVLMNPLMILVKIIKLRWIHILSYDQMVSRKINNQTTRCANSIF